jgi:hypothetical protein
MSATPPTNDPDLRELLHTWEIQTPDDAGLARRVWSQIEAETAKSSPRWVEALARLFARPAAAFAAIAAFAALGAVAGELQNSRQHEARVTQLAAEYARSIDPILMTHPADHTGHAP